MHKGDLSREFYPNFTYQIVFTHFGMYILDCHVASLLAMTDGDFVFCNDDVRKIAASSAAMTGRKWIATT